MLGIWAAVAVLVIGASSAVGEEFEDSLTVPGLDSDDALVLLQSAQSDQAGLTVDVVVASTEVGAPISGETEALAEVADAITAIDEVVFVAPPQFSLDQTVAFIRVQYPGAEQLSRETLEHFKAVQAELDEANGLRVEATGELFFTFEEPETGTGEMIGIVAAMIILVVAFGSVIAMGLPIGTALFGLALGFSAMGLLNIALDIPSWAPQLASMIGIGVGIDYALFLVTRHREYLAKGLSVEESAGRAVATAGQAVIFAGGTVVIAILGLAVAGVPFITAAGVATSVVVAIMVAAAISLLPAFLGFAGLRVNGLRKDKPLEVEVSSRWEAWGRHVAGNAWKYSIGVTALLLAFTAPILALELGFPDNGNLPEERTERQAYDLVSEAFGPGFSGPLLIAVETGGDETVLSELQGRVMADESIVFVQATPPAEGSTVATLIAFPESSPQDPSTFEAVDRLRTEVFPDVFADRDGRAHIGGQTAAFGDISDQISSRLAVFIAAVIFVSFVLLTAVFRSPLVAVKAAILNLLSIGAAYGVMVVVFQWGYGLSLIGLEETVPIVAFMPLFMFAILFGLSMDYEVFLLSRVREEYLVTGDNDQSVIHGIASTARVITSAALIMISVFGGFVLGNDPFIKMMGLGLATAIFVDATIVRIVLVPATMKLMGDTNWWIPDWLDKILPNIDVEGDAGLPPLPH